MFFLLNNDMAWRSAWGNEWDEWFSKDEKLGIVGEHEVFNRARCEKHAELNRLTPIKPLDLYFRLISGNAMIIRREVINKIGLFDEQFNPALMEDVDYSIRCQKAGFAIKGIVATYVHHSNRTIRTKMSEKELNRIIAQTSRRFFLKHYPEYFKEKE